MLKNKQKSRAREFLIEWEQSNPQFLKGESIKKDLYIDAAESLLSFLRRKQLSLIDCDIELSTDSIRWTYISIFISVTVSCALSFLGFFIPNNFPLIAFDIFLFLLFVICFDTIKASYNISKNHLFHFHFLQIVLKRYIELYRDDLKTENKIIDLLNGSFVSVPSSAETLHSERMQLAKYYQNAFIITVNNNGQKFDYILYSNSDNCSPANFIRLCKEQIGKNWNGIDKQQIVITKAPVFSGV